MDCWNFCISWILSQNKQKYEESDFIFSETFTWVTLLSKIWILLLKSSLDVEIVHENEDIFINLKECEIPLLNEYKYRLNEFQNKWGIYSNICITVPYLQEKIKDHYCIVPIKKWEWSHFVILRGIRNEKSFLIDNKKWEFSVSMDEFVDMIDLYN